MADKRVELHAFKLHVGCGSYGEVLTGKAEHPQVGAVDFGLDVHILVLAVEVYMTVGYEAHGRVIHTQMPTEGLLVKVAVEGDVVIAVPI